MSESYWFDIYFKVSKHLGCMVSDVIRNKFHPDYRVLIHKYHVQTQAEMREAKKLREQSKQYKRK